MIAHLVQLVRLEDGDSVDRQIMAYTAHLPEGSRVRESDVEAALNPIEPALAGTWAGVR